ncbi:MAG: type I-B CRISPR-associated protein Cas8b1/Cst1 [Anaerolineales bacterium]|nr:type I-B CRISPR-associated protein Cas8b1/Cst1 [Anaerolineales bacterium]
MLNYYGHPFYDVGVATITAFAGERTPEDLTEADLDKIADYISDLYIDPVLVSNLSIAFTINSGFTTPSFRKTPKKRKLYAKKMLRSYKKETPVLNERCVFTGKPAVALSLDTKDGLPVGRAFRQHIPLITGEGPINFYHEGNVGLPVSGEALLAIHALPLGCAKAGGKLLAIHSDNPKIMLRFADRFLKENQKAIHMAQQMGEKKMAETEPYGYRTLLLSLLEADFQQHRELKKEASFSITAYYFSNSGQGVSLDIYHLPSQVLDFLGSVNTPQYRATWERIVYQAWELPSKKQKDDSDFQPRRNYLYEDLFDLMTAYAPLENPQRVSRFMQTYFLRKAWKYDKQPQTDPRQAYSPHTQTQLISWDIITLFLERILYMEKEKIEAVRTLADRFAEYVNRENDIRFLNKLLWARRFQDLSRTLTLLAAQQYKEEFAQKRREAKTNDQPLPQRDENAPIIRYQEYISLFEEGEGLADRQWSLIRDLLVIRMIEWLYDKQVSLEGLQTEPTEDNQDN